MTHMYNRIGLLTQVEWVFLFFIDTVLWLKINGSNGRSNFNSYPLLYVGKESSLIEQNRISVFGSFCTGHNILCHHLERGLLNVI